MIVHIHITDYANPAAVACGRKDVQYVNFEIAQALICGEQAADEPDDGGDRVCRNCMKVLRLSGPGGKS